MDDRDVTERVRRVEELLDGAVDGHAVELAEALLDLYGEVLARIMATVSAADPPGSGEGLAERIAADELVAHLLLLHDLHPLDASTRIERALPGLRGRLAGASAELVAVEGDLARLRLRPRRGGCGSSAAPSSVVEEAVLRAAPEIERVEIDVVESTPPPVVIPVESLLRAPVRDRPGAPA